MVGLVFKSVVKFCLVIGRGEYVGSGREVEVGVFLYGVEVIGIALDIIFIVISFFFYRSLDFGF